MVANLPSRAACLPCLVLLLAFGLAMPQAANALSLAQATGSSTAEHTHQRKTNSGKKHSVAVHRTSSNHTAKAGKSRRHRRHHASARRIQRYHQAFVASTELRPMAEQLVATRTPAAFAAITAYARRHQGDAAAAAWLSLGYAYLQEGKFAEAIPSLESARKASDALADYDEFLEARADHLAGHQPQAAALLTGFADRHPDSIFDAEVPELLAQVLLAESNPQEAERVLAAAPESSGRRGYQLAQAQVAEALNHTEAAAELYRHVFVAFPLSAEATTAHARLQALGMESLLSAADLRLVGDTLYRSHRYAEAAEQYRALARHAGLGPDAVASARVAAAACDLHLKRLTEAEAEALPVAGADSAARRIDLLLELDRNRGDASAVQERIAQLQADFPHSPWLADALFSAGNMNLLSRDYSHAITDYAQLAELFPSSDHAAAAHWRAGWLSYRMGQTAQASQFFEQQIRLYPDAPETVSALYWRARLEETVDHQPSLASAHYRSLIERFTHFYYAQMARQRLAALGHPLPASLATSSLRSHAASAATDNPIPDDDPHLLKASLLINAGLGAYVPEEIAAVPDSTSWGAVVEARLYASYGETFRALRLMKRALPSAASSPINAFPLDDWRILFPQPYWSTIVAESAKNNLDPYLVASLIRQESEFNPSAISGANAFGLMQLLPSVGRQMAREEGIGPISSRQLLDPVLNIRLGTRYLRQILDHFNNVPEFALAAYNAGENRVTDWQSAGPYSGLDEFVESIPFSETRGYVEAILRNREIYHDLDTVAPRQPSLARAELPLPRPSF